MDKRVYLRTVLKYVAQITMWIAIIAVAAAILLWLITLSPWFAVLPFIVLVVTGARFLASKELGL